MKSLSLLAKVAVLSVMVVGIGACGKKSSSNSVAAVGAGYQVCPATSYIINPSTGQQQYCTPGSTVYTGVGGVGANGLYGQTGAYGQTGLYGQQYGGGYGGGCDQANMMYPGHYYMPVQGPYGPVCQLVY